MMQPKAKLDTQVEFRRATVENPGIYYEHYVLGEISLDEFKLNHRSFDRALRIKSDRD